jgi:hypothetical protein
MRVKQKPRLGFLTSSETPSLGNCQSLGTQNRKAVAHSPFPLSGGSRPRSGSELNPSQLTLYGSWKQRGAAHFILESELCRDLKTVQDRSC